MIWLFLLPFLLNSCKADDREMLTKAEPIVRKSNNKEYLLKEPVIRPSPNYPWTKKGSSKYTKITKEHFRCKGSFTNPVRTVVQKSGSLERYFDCGGMDRHSLYLKEGQEFIYPVLINLLNYVQEVSEHKVIVTSGYRCPDHSIYVEPSNRSSKHMVGAAVTFYVQDYDIQKVVNLIQKYYVQDKKLCHFERYTKEDTDCSIQPWMNKEIYFKVYKENEGRNCDNSHPFSYISLQVRHDMSCDKKVVYSWEEAFRSYLRK